MSVVLLLDFYKPQVCVFMMMTAVRTCKNTVFHCADLPLEVSGSWESLAECTRLAQENSFTPSPAFAKLERHRLCSLIKLTGPRECRAASEQSRACCGVHSPLLTYPSSNTETQGCTDTCLLLSCINSLITSQGNSKTSSFCLEVTGLFPLAC